MKRNNIAVAVVILMLVAAFFAVFRLTESPPTWMDEGLILSIPKTLVESGVYMVQVAPHTFISPSYITTGYTVVLPVAASFKLFGVGLLQARAVMVVFILSLLIASYVVMRRFSDNGWLAVASLALIATFPPLYGNGKNVLGEIPGLLFFMAFLYFFRRYEKGDKRIRVFVLSGLFLGLCVATKPIFILLLPAVVISLLIAHLRRETVLEWVLWKRYVLGVLSSLVPIALWLYLYFSDSSKTISEVLSYYSNPYKMDVWTAVISNLKSFVTAFSPMFFLLFFSVWACSVVVRYLQRVKITLVELVPFLFSVLVFAAYLRDPGYYRYYFLAEYFAILFFPFSLWYLMPKWRFKNSVLYASIGGLMIINLYCLMFSSWVATYYNSTKTRDSYNALSVIPADKSVYFYNAFDMRIFLRGTNYYQYTDFLDTGAARQGKEDLLLRSVPDMVVITESDYASNSGLFGGYAVSSRFSKYDLLVRK